MPSDSNDRIETRVIHGGQQHEPITGAVMQPVFQTSTYAQPWPAKHTGYEYARTQNPTREALERCVATLEEADHGIAFGSGLAATSAVMQMLPANARIVAGDDLYGGTYRVFTQVFSKAGLTYTFADLSTDLDTKIPEGTDLVWLESPTNPLLKITDIAAVVARARAVGALVAVDNTRVRDAHAHHYRIAARDGRLRWPPALVIRKCGVREPEAEGHLYLLREVPIRQAIAGIQVHLTHRRQIGRGLVPRDR